MVRTMCTVVVVIDVKDSDGTLVAHTLLGDTDDLLIVVGKGDALDGRRELPYEETLAGLHRPEPHLIVRRTRHEESRLCYWGISKSKVGKGRGSPEGKGETRTVDIYCPNRAVVSVIGTKTLSIMREPNVDDMVFGA